MKLRSGNCICTLAILLCVIFSMAFAQTNFGLNVDSVNSDAFPAIEARLSVTGAGGFPLNGLEEKDLTLAEDGKDVGAFTLETAYQKPVAVVLLVATNTSMKYSKALEKTVRAAKEFAGGLGNQDAVAVVEFNSRVNVVQDFTNDKMLVNTALDSLKPKGNSSLYDGLMQAVELLQNRPERRMIVLVTNFSDSGTSKYTFNQAVDAASRQSIFIYPISFEGANKNEINKMAALSFGKAQTFTHSDGLQAAFLTVSQWLPEVRLEYVVKFNSTLPADNQEHNLLVKANFLGRTAEQSHHFVALPSQVSITLPGLADGQAVGGKVSLAPQVLSRAPVDWVEISLDGQPVTTLTAAPFEYVWDTQNVPPGEHALGFQASDTAGNNASTQVKVKVQPAIELKLTKPAAGEAPTGKVMLAAEVQSVMALSQVTFYVNDQVVGSVSQAPYELEWDAGNLTPGPYTIRAEAVDAQNNTATAAVEVNVGLQQGSGLFWVAGIAVLVMAGVVIPFSLRRRRTKAAPPPIQENVIEAEMAVASLHEIQGLHPNQVWPLNQAETRLGRKRDENDIVLKGLTASRSQAVIRRTLQGYTITSERADNPVLVNGGPVVVEQALAPGDTIQAGESLFQFEL